MNRHVQGRLLVAAALFAAAAIANGLLAYDRLSPVVRQQAAAWVPAVLALGVVIAIVALALNPWRVDRVSDRFPHIVQDTVVIALFALAATLILQERVLATTAVGAVVVGLALQDTLGNLFSGLAIQIEKPFHVGDWVGIGDKSGQVAEVTWRATKLRTIAGNMVVVPNSTIGKETITNYSQPTTDVRLDVEVGVSYDTPPNVVKSVILDAIRDEPLLSKIPPDVLLVDFAASAITYRVRVWASGFDASERVKDRVRTCIYYAFKRHDLSIPFPIQVQMRARPTPVVPRSPLVEAIVSSAEIFQPLNPDQIGQLLASARTVLYAAGETIVRQGDPGNSMYVIVSGEAVVTLDGSREVARFSPGAYFGEMSLLTGDPRTATVTAVTDCELLEWTAESFRDVALNDPAVFDLVGMTTATRRNELERHRLTDAASHSIEPAPSLVSRMRRFLRLANN